MLYLIKVTCALVATILFLAVGAQAQRRSCATVNNYNNRVIKNSQIIQHRQLAELNTQQWIANSTTKKISGAIITIPVVVHVVYHTTTQNISMAQIQSQIDVLNKDFRKLNADTLLSSHSFASSTADLQIEFCLASVDPLGNPTNGVTRTYTDTINFGQDEYNNEKHTSTGGHDAWDATKYLNIWVCDIDAAGLLGYATLPSDLSIYPNEDGVVINYLTFGTIGTAGTNGNTVFNLGRTATHEIGHWLNLNHIWGDATCGDDLVADTERAQGPNFDCPSFPNNPNNSCGSSINGEMYMNYMDYVDDGCMNMFTAGQSVRVQATLHNERLAILTSNACNSANAIKSNSTNTIVSAYPNPSNGTISLSVNTTENATIKLYNTLGLLVKQINNVVNFPFTLQANDLSNGIYTLQLITQNFSVTKLVSIVK